MLVRLMSSARYACQSGQSDIDGEITREAAAAHQQEWQALTLLVGTRGRLGGLHAAATIDFSTSICFRM